MITRLPRSTRTTHTLPARRSSDRFARQHAAHELRAVLAVAGCEHVLGPHRGADAEVGGLVSQAGGVGAELAGALQGDRLGVEGAHVQHRSEEHTSELQSLMRISYAVFCLKKKKNKQDKSTT